MAKITRQSSTYCTNLLQTIRNLRQEELDNRSKLADAEALLNNLTKQGDELESQLKTLLKLYSEDPIIETTAEDIVALY
tara:strand:+ start:214 stop:450 length:237 start_codon:yes stop_codon:yes gene_type:complete